jgi:hypothetical protein
MIITLQVWDQGHQHQHHRGIQTPVITPPGSEESSQRRGSSQATTTGDTRGHHGILEPQFVKEFIQLQE